MIYFLLFCIIFLRYLLSSFIIDHLVQKSSKERIVKVKRKSGQVKREIMFSFTTALIFSIGMGYLFQLYQDGTLEYATNSPYWYHPLSIIIALLIHETYYYWLHRLMHTRRVYKYMHKGHHDSVAVSAWSSFAFDWLESIFQVLAFYLIALILPLHLYSILFLLSFMTVTAIINHLNIETYPKFFKTHWLLKHFIGGTHHALHHKEFKTNYGLYFTFWDKWMNTESKNY